MEDRDERAVEAVKWSEETFRRNSAAVGRAVGDPQMEAQIALLLGRAIVELEMI